MSRSIRRHHAARMKAKFYRKQSLCKRWGETSPRTAGMFANHGKTCSCWMCGNQRITDGRTMQELRSDLEAEVLL